MAGASIIAAALTDHSAHSYSLWIAGVDVLKDPVGQLGRKFGVPIESIEVTLGGPGATGSMTFTVDDPVGNTFGIYEGMDVLFWDHVRNVPMFAGYVDGVTDAIPEGIVHTLGVRCSDLNAVLDRVLLEAFTYPDGSAQTQIQSIMQFVPLRAFGSLSTDAAGVREGGSQSKPVGGAYPTQVATTLSGDTIADGTTARDAIQQVLVAWGAQVGYTLSASLQCFVDQYGGLRLYDSFYAVVPSDYRQTTVTVASGTVTEPAAVRPDDLTIESDGSQLVTNVYVVGGNAAGTGWVVGLAAQGRGSVRRDARYSQPKSLDAIAKFRYGQAYLDANGVQYRCSFSMSWRSPFTILPGDYLFTSTGGYPYQVQGYVRSVRQAFAGGGNLREYAVEYGNLGASLARTLR